MSSTPSAPPSDGDLSSLFAPKSVAVIGASRERGTIGAEIVHNLLRCGFQGVVYPVNPSAHAVQGVRAYPSIRAIDDHIELAILAVPGKYVLPVAEECAQAGVRAMVVITAGFKEIGGEGAEREAALRALVRKHNIRLVGPNCLGVINAHPSVRLDATFAPTWPRHGHLGFLTQSGALGVAILDYGHELGIGISSFVSIGNRADVSANDVLEYWEHDPDTNIILLYLESFGNPIKFTRIARRIARHKPIIAVKSGRSTYGARAASSHTGALAGVDSAADAIFWQTGVIRVDTLEELFNTALLLENQPVPKGPRVAIVTNAGGPGILATDACAANGLEVPLLSEATQNALRSFLPKEASTRNPVDMIASASPEHYRKTLLTLMDDPDIDSVIAIFVPPIVTNPREVAEAIQAAAARRTKPILCNFLGTHGVPESLRSLQSNSIPSYAFPEAAAIALSRATQYGKWLARPHAPLPLWDDIDIDAARAVFAEALTQPPEPDGSLWLSTAHCGRLLQAYNIPFAAQTFATNADEAVQAATSIGFPVVLKLESDGLVHKSDLGGVHLDLQTAEDVRTACAQITQALEQNPDAPPLRGFTVQAMIHDDDSTEMILGVTRDPVFGRLMMCGFGGVLVELLDDVSVRVHPLEDIDATEMIYNLRGLPLLEGYRNQAPRDLAALRAMILRINTLLTDFPLIDELDLNPVKLRAQGHGAIAVDARIKISAQPPSTHRA